MSFNTPVKAFNNLSLPPNHSRDHIACVVAMRPFDFQSLCTPVGFACTYLYRVAVPLPVCHIGCILSSVPGGLPIAILVRTVTVSADAVSEATSDVSSFNGDCVSLPVFTPLLRRGDTCLLAGCKESYSARDFPVPVPQILRSRYDLGRASVYVEVTAGSQPQGSAEADPRWGTFKCVAGL